MYKEVTVKKYFCGRCGKEVKPPKTGVIALDRLILDHSGQAKPFYLNGAGNGVYLCSKCMKELELFIKNKYPTKQSEKEKMLSDKLEEIADILTCDFSTLHEHVSAIQEYTGAIISSINGSPFNIKEDGLNYFSAESKSAKLLRELRGIKKGE